MHRIIFVDQNIVHLSKHERFSRKGCTRVKLLFINLSIVTSRTYYTHMVWSSALTIWLERPKNKKIQNLENHCMNGAASVDEGGKFYGI